MEHFMRNLSCCSGFFIVASLLAVEQRPPNPTKDSTLSDKLDEILAGKQLFDSVCLKVKRIEDEKESSVTIYGDGLGVNWQGKQYKLPEKQRLALLGKLKDAKFMEMPEYFGEQPWDFKEGMAKTASHGHGSVSLQIGNQSKATTQLGNGELSEQFSRLTNELLSTCEVEAVSVISASNLADGLQKILDDKIDVRAMKIEVGYGRSVAFHTLRIEGRAAEIHGTDYWAKRFSGRDTLKADQLKAFIKVLQKDKFTELPDRIVTQYDYDHVSVRVRVLDKQHEVWGSGFSTKKSTEEHRNSFEAIFDASDKLNPPRETEKKK
jgi:hypothetical protein